ncbi:MAG TPA: phenylalanine--tRNA ligase subunit alpha [Deltaproteobacteria bacterium]|nr:phenylalanine--tRNA ligase subunit alpha [Deltaproteobacteria bacterium]
MLDELEALRQAAEQEITAAGSDAELQAVRTRYLGKKGKLTAVLKGISSLPPAERGATGQAANQLKRALSEAVVARSEALLDAAAVLPEGFDPTRPGIAPPAGGLHPITQMIYDLNDAFATLGFEIYDGPEISSELYAFDHLNFPPDHPARETMDTYWLGGSEGRSGADRLCLRPHLTGGSVRYMQTHTPPFRFVYPGRVFRNETTDASHERAFCQYEALIMDRRLPFSGGKLLVDTILEVVFGREVPIRMRAGFFPFVEPGFEIDMQCLVCSGSGCSVCKRTGWLEVMPGGPPHPEVLRAGGLDPDAWEGFYINVGLDRLVMMRYGVDDVRLFHSGDLRFLNQFA